MRVLPLKPVPPSPRCSPHPQYHRLANGITAIVTPNLGADIVAARLFLRAGSAGEAPEERGLAHLMTATLTKGTAQRSALALAIAVESLGVGFGIDVTHDYWVMSLKAVGEDFPVVLALAAEVLRSPTFPEAELELERRMALHLLQSQREQVFSLALDSLNGALYGSHAYSHSSVGTAASLLQIDRAQIQAFYDRQVRPERLIVSLAGNFTTDQALAWIEASLGDWRSGYCRSQHGKSQHGRSRHGKSQHGRSQHGKSQSGKSQHGKSQHGRSQHGKSQSGKSQHGKSQHGRSAALADASGYNHPLGNQPAIPPLPPPPLPQSLSQVHPSQQVMLMLGYRVPGVTDPAYVPLKLLCAYLGNGMSSRLFVQLRERQGLAYDVSAFYPTRALGSALVAYGGTAPEKAAIALRALQQELHTLSQEPLTAAVVANLQRKVLGQYLLGQQTNEQLAHLFGWYEVLGLGLGFDQAFQDQVLAQTGAELWTVAQTHLQVPSISVVGPKATIETLTAGWATMS